MLEKLEVNKNLILKNRQETPQETKKRKTEVKNRQQTESKE